VTTYLLVVSGPRFKRPDEARGFCLLPRRWVVERTFAWLGRNRRLAKDFEATVGSAEAWLYLASVQLLARRRRQHADRAVAILDASVKTSYPNKMSNSGDGKRPLPHPGEGRLQLFASITAIRRRRGAARGRDSGSNR
jgi:hypothetical protein